MTELWLRLEGFFEILATRNVLIEIGLLDVTGCIAMPQDAKERAAMTAEQELTEGKGGVYTAAGWEHWPDDPWFSYQFRRALGETQEGGGAELHSGRVHHLTHRIGQPEGHDPASCQIAVCWPAA